MESECNVILLKFSSICKRIGEIIDDEIVDLHQYLKLQEHRAVAYLGRGRGGAEATVPERQVRPRALTYSLK